ncbi:MULTISPECIES: Ycf66 family protein [Cyanophyceae]|uniref:Ycf66 family protein n=1 Tax=Cyanophyceae TaxID=3028117 RepID=UPI00016DC76B|nr:MULTISPECIES: Ycf66 family protein [unclassified Picosynechococcus]ACA98765.1 Ycf66-like protein [Picosynechococcus sp. PCC 7002]SMH38891.1 Ycf66 protein N-terminus [Picosynechococcus sp. OG1]SMQ78109.1 Ycf66 protein N-terminus [Synechococcus sp. 7002]
MVNFGLNSASILGIALAAAGASLYFLRSVRPELSRDHDIFFAAVGLLCGFILLFQGWRLDPILQFGQFLLSGSAVFFAIESIRLRGLATEQARRNTPIVDDERPVSRVYRAELDQIEPYQGEERYERRLRGYPEPRSSRSRGYEDEAPRGTSTRPSSRPTNRPPTDYGDRPSGRPTSRRPSRPSPPSRRPPRPDRYENGGYDAYGPSGNVTDVWSEDAWDQGDRPVDETPRRPRRPRPDDEPSAPRRPRRPRPDNYGAPDEEVATVDYQPIDGAAFGEDQDWDDPAPDNPEMPEGDRPNNPVNFDY